MYKHISCQKPLLIGNVSCAASRDALILSLPVVWKQESHVFRSLCSQCGFGVCSGILLLHSQKTSAMLPSPLRAYRVF